MNEFCKQGAYYCILEKCFVIYLECKSICWALVFLGGGLILLWAGMTENIHGWVFCSNNLWQYANFSIKKISTLQRIILNNIVWHSERSSYSNVILIILFFIIVLVFRYIIHFLFSMVPDWSIKGSNFNARKNPSACQSTSTC